MENPAFYLVNVYDVSVHRLNCAVSGEGASRSGTASPSDISFTGCTFQQGGVGVQVGDGFRQIRFTGVMAKDNLADGWQFPGTGTALSQLTGHY